MLTVWMHGNTPYRIIVGQEASQALCPGFHQPLKSQFHIRVDIVQLKRLPIRVHCWPDPAFIDLKVRTEPALKLRNVLRRRHRTLGFL